MKRSKKRLRSFTRAHLKPVLGSKDFIGRVKQRLGKNARVEEEKPESRRLFSPGLDQIVEATARGYGKTIEELKRRRRGGEKEARVVAIYLGRQLGGDKHEDIGKTVGSGERAWMR